VPKIDLNLLRKRCKSPNEEHSPEELPFKYVLVLITVYWTRIFRYPTTGGIGDLWKKLADKYPQKVFMYNTNGIVYKIFAFLKSWHLIQV
jgi:hypothetical protein